MNCQKKNFLFFLFISLIYFSQSIALQSTKIQVNSKTTNVNCASENGICNLPNNHICSVSYGEGNRWVQKHGLVGAVGCNNSVFGDPFFGTFKRCYYYQCVERAKCSDENGVCTIPNGKICKVHYGVDSRWNQKSDQSGAVSCNNGNFGDPAVGTFKACYYSDCRVDLREEYRNCSNENGICILPQGETCSVRYGKGNTWTTKTKISENIGCNNGNFGDPLYGTFKECQYFNCIKSLSNSNGNLCSSENGICKVPEGKFCNVDYGVDSKWTQKRFVYKQIECNNSVFGDPAVGIGKSCYYNNCVDFNGCSVEGGVCNIPKGQICSVQYGQEDKIITKNDIQGQIACNNEVFGDPYKGIFKKCIILNCRDAEPVCAKEGEECKLPSSLNCSVKYGKDGKFFIKEEVSGSIGCNNSVFGDPNVGIVKQCHYFNCKLQSRSKCPHRISIILKN